MSQPAEKIFDSLLTVVDGQQTLPLRRIERPSTEDVRRIAKIRSMSEALQKCAAWSEDFDDWAALSKALGIDPGQMTRIKKGSAHFPENKSLTLFNTTGLAVPVWWLLLQMGFDPTTVRRSMNEQEHHIAELEQALQEKERENVYLRKALRNED